MAAGRGVDVIELADLHCHRRLSAIDVTSAHPVKLINEMLVKKTSRETMPYRIAATWATSHALHVKSDSDFAPSRERQVTMIWGMYVIPLNELDTR